MAKLLLGSNSNKLMTRDINIAEAALLGIRFRPTDEELIMDYLAPAAADNKALIRINTVIDYDVYSCAPWCLPRHLFEYSALQNDMYFISVRQPKTDVSKSKVDRRVAGEEGFWCYNSKRIAIKKNRSDDHGGDDVVIGIKCTLNYMMFKEAYTADQSNNNKKKKKKKKNKMMKKKEKTSWIMHEYTLFQSSSSSHQDPITCKFQDVVLCHIYDTAPLIIS